ncbi:MAG: phosphatase PAP2 family protein [candidate division Zixibacteria bacterium]|nr:phosphatase PAP2 family protein [candidate division Zixibacteria bacterium]
MLKNKQSAFERFTNKLLPYDHMVLIYCWLIIVLTLNFARPIEHFVVVIVFHFGVIVFVTLLAHFAHNVQNRLVVFFRLLYPIILVVFFYSTSGELVHIIFPVFLDQQIIGLEQAVFGISPTIWLDKHLNVFITEILSASYFSYYFLVIGLAFFLFFGKKDAEIKRFMTATCATFFISYLIFIFYPVEGPRHVFAATYENVITGPFFRKIVDLVINNGAFHGGAMPSSHCAEALVVAFFAIRYYGKKARFLIPVVIGLSLGTVYGRFHYVSDVIVGLIISIVTIWLTLYFYPTNKEEDLTANKS